MRDGGRLGGNRVQDLASEQQLRLADTQAAAEDDDRGDVRRGVRLDSRHLRVGDGQSVGEPRPFSAWRHTVSSRPAQRF